MTGPRVYDDNDDPWDPEAWRCGVCGGPDQAHRMVDAQQERVIAGEPVHDVAADYDLTVPEMVARWASAYGRALESWDWHDARDRAVARWEQERAASDAAAERDDAQ